MEEPILLRRALRRYYAYTNQRRRILERWGIKYYGSVEKFIVHLKEQPKRCARRCCGNPRRFRYYTLYEYSRDEMGKACLMMKRRKYASFKERLTLAEQRANFSFKEQLKELT